MSIRPITAKCWAIWAFISRSSFITARALELGPENRSLRLVQPEEFQVKSVWLEEDVCYVNLSSSQLETLPEETDMPMILQALALSLCSLDTVSEVRFLVDGDFAAEYGGASIADPYIV